MKKYKITFLLLPLLISCNPVINSSLNSSSSSQSNIVNDIKSTNFEVEYYNSSKIKNCAEGLILVHKKSSFNEKERTQVKIAIMAYFVGTVELLF